MEAIIERKQTSFRLSTELLRRLQIAARRENRSLNNYVESALMDVVCKIPNADTEEAIREARSEKSAGRLDMASFDSFVKSIDEIE